MRTAPQRERSDVHDPRRGFAALKTNSRSDAHDLRIGLAEVKADLHGATAGAIQHTHRVRRDQDTVARRHIESDLHARSPLMVRRGPDTFARRHNATARAIRHAPSPHDLRTGFAEIKTHSHGATARAIRRARSPQRVRCAIDKFAVRRARSPHRVRRGQSKFARRDGRSDPTDTRNPA